MSAPSADGFRSGFANGVAQPDEIELVWSGAPLPRWLDGAVLVRNGPGLFGFRDQRMNHWFDGLAMLTRFEFAGGSVRYRSAFLDSRDYADASAAGRARFTEFGTAPQRSWRERLHLLTHPGELFGDNASVNVIPVGDEWWALWDIPRSMRLDGTTLATVGPAGERFDRRVLMRTPHPLYDSVTGEWINVGLGLTSRGPGYTVFSCRAPEMEMRPVRSVASWAPAYLHSFAMSRNHVVITEHPFGPTPRGGVALLLGSRPLVNGCRWRRDHRTRMIVVDRRDSGEVRRVDIDPVAVLHHVNAFEDGDGTLVVDGCTFTDRDVLNRLFFRHLDAPDGGSLARSRLQRYRIDLASGAVGISLLTERPLEMPFVDPRRAGSAYRYVYGVSMRTGNDFNDELLKVDVESGSTQAFAEPGLYPGEPVFVPRPDGDGPDGDGPDGDGPDGDAEDDGVVLSLLLDANEGCSFLVVLDAASFTEIGRARLPHIVPHGLHGNAVLGSAR